MTTTSELLIHIRDELANSVILSNWCQAKYAKRPVIITGINIEDPPTSSDYPVVVIEDITSLSGNTGPIKEWAVSLGCGVYDTTVTETSVTVPPDDPEDDPTPVSTTRTYAGLADVETMREMVEGILKASHFAKITFNTESAPISLYPEFHSFTLARVEQINTRRRL